MTDQGGNLEALDIKLCGDGMKSGEQEIVSNRKVGEMGQLQGKLQNHCVLENVLFMCNLEAYWASEWFLKVKELNMKHGLACSKRGFKRFE